MEKADFLDWIKILICGIKWLNLWISVLLHKLNSQTTPWPLEVKINIILLKSITQSSKSIDVLWMLGPDENLIKCTLLVQRSPQALIDYHTMVFSPQFSSFIRQSIQERYIYIYIEREREGGSRYDYESTRYYQEYLSKGKQNISSFHKIIRSLVSSFLIYLMIIVAACKVSSVFNGISLVSCT